MTAESGTALRAWFEDATRRLKSWFLRPWNAARLGKSGALLVLAVGILWMAVRAGQWLWMRWQMWRRPQEFDPVRRTAGRFLARLRDEAEPPQPPVADREVIPDLQRLRYGRRETWPEPQAVFRRAKRARRAMRR